MKTSYFKIWDPPCENPAKVIFLWFAVLYKKKILYITFCENVTFKSLILSKDMSNIEMIVELMVEIKLWCLLSHN